MKAVIFADTAFPVVGGGQVHLHSFYKYLIKLGHLATVFTNVTTVPAGDGADYLREKWPSKHPFALAKLFIRIWKLISPCTVVYCLYSYRLTALAAVTAKLQGKPVYIFAHGLGTIINPDDPFSHRLYRYISLKLADGIFGSSEELSAIARRYNKNVLTLPPGADAEYLDQQLDPAATAQLRQAYAGRKIILTVRRLVPKNGIQYLIEALPLIIKRDPTIKYLVLGDGRMRPNLERRVQELGLSEYVDWLGERPNSEVYRFLALADVVVFPSSAEAMSIACIEAMMVGVPVVATKVGGLVDLLGRNNERGLLVDLFGTETSTYAAPPVRSIGLAKYQELADRVLESIIHPDPIRLRRAQTMTRENYAWSQLIKLILDFSHGTKGN